MLIRYCPPASFSQQVPDRETPVYTLVVMAANKKVDWKLLRKKLGKKAKLVSREDVQKISGCIPGAVPPFGSLLKTKANTLVDPSLQKQGTSINFNAVSGILYKNPTV